MLGNFRFTCALAAAFLFCAAPLSVLAQQPSYCTNFQIKGATYTNSLSWWINQPPLVIADNSSIAIPTKYVLAICSALPDACGNDSCKDAYSSAACEYQTQKDGQTGTCLAAVSDIPYFKLSNAGTHRSGFQMQLSGGDPLSPYSFSNYTSIFTFICSEDKEPRVVQAGYFPNTVFYAFDIKHCSGCPTNDKRFCHGGISNIHLSAKVVSNSTEQIMSLIPSHNDLHVSISANSELSISGVVTSPKDTVDIMVSNSGSSASIVSIQFTGKSSLAVFSMNQSRSAKAQCRAIPAASASNNVAFSCNLLGSGELIIEGTAF